jgi:hypothetical protein
MNYRTKDMARAEGLTEQPYKNLIQYRKHVESAGDILKVPAGQIVSEEDEIEQEGGTQESNSDAESD